MTTLHFLNPFNMLLKFIILFSVFATLSACGNKAPLYLPDVDKRDIQSDQAFLFPPERKETAKE